MGGLKRVITHVSSVPSRHDDSALPSPSDNEMKTWTTTDSIQSPPESTSGSIFRLHVKAVAWSVLLSTVIIMESFGIVVTTGFFKLDSFQETFGQLSPLGGYYVPSSYQSAIVNAVLCGEIAGLLLCGWATERIGLRRMLVMSLVAISMLLFMLFFATRVGIFIAGQFLCGIPLGVFQTVPVNYAQDILPDSLKPYLTTYLNFCWAFGGLLGSSVQRGTMHVSDNWSWRLPIALQWLWPVPLIIGIALAPESPVWLTRRERDLEALRSLRRLTPNPDDTYEIIARTNAQERELTAGANYLDCFRGLNIRRTESTCMAWAIQMICGSTLMYFATSFFEEAGLDANKAYTLTPALYGVGCAGTLFSWFLIAKFRRRTLYLAGNLFMAVILFGMGIAGIFTDAASAKWAAAILLIAFTLVYDCTVGPVCYCLVGELPSSRLKQKTVPLARCVYLVLSIVMNFLVPKMLGREAGEWKWGAKAGFFFGGGCLLSLVWVHLRLPETKDRTVEEIDAVFERLHNERDR